MCRSPSDFGHLVWFGLVWFGLGVCVVWCGVVNKSNIFEHILTEIYQLLSIVFVFTLFAFHVHVAGGTLST